MELPSWAVSFRLCFVCPLETLVPSWLDWCNVPYSSVFRVWLGFAADHDCYHYIIIILLRLLLLVFLRHILSILSWYQYDIIPESIWANGSSNNGGLLCTFTSSHLHIYTYHHIIFTSSHNLLIFTSTHIIFTSSHLLIITSAHIIFTSSHLHIFTSSHLHIFTSSHLHIFTSSHLHIFTSSFYLSLSLSPPFSLSHIHIFTFSLSLSLSLALLPALCHGLSSSVSFLSYGGGRRRRGATKWPPLRTKWGSIVKNWGKIR